MLSALVILCAMPGLYARGETLLTAPPQFDCHYVFAPSGGFRDSASVPCRRKPGLQSASAPNAATPAMRTFGAGAVWLQGDAKALRLETRDAPIAGVLTAIADAFHVQFRNSIMLDEQISGAYEGSLSRVIAQLLRGYNYYVIERKSSALEVTIVGKRGERAVPAALAPAGGGPLRRGRCGQSAGHQAACHPI